MVKCMVTLPIHKSLPVYCLSDSRINTRSSVEVLQSHLNCSKETHPFKWPSRLQDS